MRVVARIVLRTPQEVALQLYGLTLASYWQIKRGFAPRDFWAQNVRYEREPPGRDDWQTWAITVARGAGDCEDLATALTACRWAQGDKSARAIVKPIRPGLIHILTRYGNGEIVDPSKLLGMAPP